jgi:hypothetical protein
MSAGMREGDSLHRGTEHLCYGARRNLSATRKCQAKVEARISLDLMRSQLVSNLRINDDVDDRIIPGGRKAADESARFKVCETKKTRTHFLL